MMIGYGYRMEIPTFSRDPAADEVLFRLSAPADAVLVITEIWWGQGNTDNLNEVNAMSFVRLSTDGTGGATALFEQDESGIPATGATGAGLDADGWSAQPTVTDTLGGPRPWNLANGFQWAPKDEGDYILLSPSARFGIRMIRSPSAPMQWYGGCKFREIGG